MIEMLEVLARHYPDVTVRAEEIRDKRGPVTVNLAETPARTLTVEIPHESGVFTAKGAFHGDEGEMRTLFQSFQKMESTLSLVEKDQVGHSFEHGGFLTVKLEQGRGTSSTVRIEYEHGRGFIHRLSNVLRGAKGTPAAGWLHPDAHKRIRELAAKAIEAEMERREAERKQKRER